MSDINFKQALRDAGIPTQEAELRQAWEAEVTRQGSPLSNTGAYSPFWRIISALITRPTLWLFTFMSDTVLPNFFVKTARGPWLDSLAWAVNTQRKAATRALGTLVFTRASAAGSLEVPAGTRVQSPAINGHVYELTTVGNAWFKDGETQLSIAVNAVESGSGYNLAPGYYAILPVPVTGIVAAVNPDRWLTQPGADPEPDEALRLRARNQFAAVNQWHTDAVYRAMIASFPGVRPDGVYFQHGAPRGPGTANAFVLFEAGAPANDYLALINRHIRDDGHHGHGDDLLVMAMPETQHALSMELWLKPHLDRMERQHAQAQIELFIRAAFRESSPKDYQPTLTLPQSRFSFSRLGEELHEQFPQIESLRFANADIVSELEIARLAQLEVTLND